MRPADQHPARRSGADTGDLPQPRRDRTDQHGQLGWELDGLGLEELDGAGRCTGSARTVARGAGRLGWPTPGDPFTVVLQEHCQPGAEAARSFHRPAATAGNLHAGEAQQLPAAGRVGAG